MSARELLARVLGPRADEFDIEIIDGPDAFEVEALAGRVLLRGTNGIAIASALRLSRHLGRPSAFVAGTAAAAASAGHEPVALPVPLQLLHLRLLHRVLGLGPLGA
jgi:hypothetical protein